MGAVADLIQGLENSRIGSERSKRRGSAQSVKTVVQIPSKW
jgi:hypothetical protein